MIRDLSITNLGVIEATRLEFHPGLTVLTGETGAGKTLITTALSLLLGAKSEPVLVRHGAAEAAIDCTVVIGADSELLDRLDALGALVEEGELIVSRSVGARSRAVVGSRPVAAASLASLLGDRITVHGQHGQVRLTRTVDQRILLDASAVAIGRILPVVRQAWVNLREAQAALDAARSVSAQDEHVLASHRALVEDFASVAPALGEDVALDARVATLSALEAIERATRTAAAMLADGDTLDITDASMLLSQTRRLLEPHATMPEFEQWISRLIDAQESVSSVAHDISAYVDALEADESRLDEVLARRSQIGGLLRRWNCDLDALVERYDDACQALALASDPEQQLLVLQDFVEHCEAELLAVCDQLHRLRMASASALSMRVQSELRELGLPHAEFQIAVERQQSPTQHGDDMVEFRFSANPGQPAQPLASVGSGGELSRVMLALETVAVDVSSRTFVFDEVDAGVGGKAALEVGRRLADLALGGQVIVVTHLAQVAAFADRHIVVEKLVKDGSTLTTTRTLAADERPRELTRLLSGVEDSASAMAHAVELLDLARASRGGAT